MTEKFLIKGNRSLQGEIEISGYKNAAGACLAAVLLTKDEIIKGLNKKIVEEKERAKKLEDTVIEIEEYTYKLKGDIDRVTKERDFLKDEIDRFRKKYGF